MRNILDFGKPQVDRLPNPIAIVAIDKHEKKLHILEFVKGEIYNFGVMDCYEDHYFYNDLEFDVEPGLYKAELDIEDTTVNYGADGIEYDCEPNVIFKQRFNFDSMEWVDYDQSQKNDCPCQSTCNKC
jgi:hypothetical protein